MIGSDFSKLKEIISKEKALLKEIQKNPSAQNIQELKKINDSIPSAIESISISKPSTTSKTIPGSKVKVADVFSKEKLKQAQSSLKKKPLIRRLKKYDKEELELEREVVERVKKGKRKVVKKQIKKPSTYVKFANKLFSNISVSFYKKPSFRSLREDLIKGNLFILPVSYISVILLTTMLSAIAGIFIFLFFLFFNIGIELPIITLYEGEFLPRLLYTFWILFVIPIATFFILYLYPSLEKKSVSSKIKQELPFVTIHLSAISGSMIEPSKLFEIITSTKEYPNISKEFTKIINEINIYGYNLVGALRQSANNTASEGLRDLFNGLATTITSGGDLKRFFDERAKTLLFDYKIEREKYTKLTETFMDIYISVVIAAPMILMLLLMMIRISGLGISLSTQMISVIMVLGVSMINAGFLVFLRLKQPET